jgi:hypothetical protein
MSTAIASLFGAGINKHFGLQVKTYSPKYTRVMHVINMTGRILDRQGWEMYQPPEITLPLNPVHMSEIQQSFSKRYFPIKRTLGDVVSEEDWDDDEYGVLKRVIPSKGGAMAEVFIQKKEYDAANLFAVAGFSSASPVAGSPDGKALFATDHPVSLSNSGTTASNRPSTPVDLSHTAYYAAYANMVQQNAANNYTIIEDSPATLVYNPTQRQIAVQIAKGDWERETLATSKMNAAKADNLTLVEWAHFRKTGAGSAANSWNGWFIEGHNHSVNFANRQDFRAKADYAINVQGYIWVASVRYDLGWDDWRSTYGSPGA